MDKTPKTGPQLPPNKIEGGHGRFIKGMKNHPRGMLSKKHTEEWKRMMSEKMKGRKILWKDKIGLTNSIILKGRKLSKEHKRNIGKANQGNKCYFWKGGITKLRDIIRGCSEYCQWRLDIFIRDNFICQLCGLRGVYLEADHYPKRFADILNGYRIKTLEEALECEELWDINNGRSLCKECHNKYGKRR